MEFQKALEDTQSLRCIKRVRSVIRKQIRP